ncbi:MAG: hypothetical protein ACRDNZ_07470, partial [Streptosporangiaceae bacterium]
MGVVALATWLATAAGGLYLLAVWLIEYDGGLRTSAQTRLPIPVIGTHSLLAVAGIVVWSVHLFTGDPALAWITLVILGCVALLGLGMAVRWLHGYRTEEPASIPTVTPERNFPVTVVVLHGLLGVATVVLVLTTILLGQLPGPRHPAASPG